VYSLLIIRKLKKRALGDGADRYCEEARPRFVIRALDFQSLGGKDRSQRGTWEL